MDIEGLCGLVLDVLEEAESAAIKFGQDIDHECPSRCGDCCKMDKPEDSVLAALPAVLWAVEHNYMGALTDAVTETPEDRCFFYKENTDKHCSIYPLNNAFHMAAEWILFYRQFDSCSSYYNSPG